MRSYMVSMATMQTTSQVVVPLHLSGNTSETQNQAIQVLLNEAMQGAYKTALDQLDKQTAQAVLDVKEKLKQELAEIVVGAIHRYAVSDKFKDECVHSNRVYPPTYRPRSIEAQVTELRKAFPALQYCNEKLARRPLPGEAEAWFAIPRWQAIAPTYNEAVEMMIEKLSAKRRFSNRIIGRLTQQYLRESDRTKLAQSILLEQQPESDIFVVGAQFGMLHRGSSARRTRAVMACNEFALGTFATGCMLLTHPERLSNAQTLMIDCGGDEYSIGGDYTFDRVPLFDYDMSGIEFSIFYEDRARNLWGTPTAFLFQQA